MLNSSEEFIYSYGGPNTYEDQIDFALGLALGGKFITKKGFVGELYLGAGGNLFNENAIDAVPRFGISLGKRF